MTDTMTENMPTIKKLRYSEPDLKVTLRYTDSAGNEATKEYNMHGLLLAKMSNYADMTLADAEMQEIELARVTPEVFEFALQLEDDLSLARTVTIEDVLKVAPFYHMYEFSSGLKLCDSVISERLEQESKMDSSNLNIDFIVNVIVAAKSFDLEQSKVTAIKFLNDTFGEGLAGTIFSLEHLTNLQALFTDPLLATTLSAITASTLNTEEIESRLFPKFLKVCLENNASVITRLTLKLSYASFFDGEYKKEGDTFVQTSNGNCTVHKDVEGHWVIANGVTTLWKNLSRSSNPPISGWISVGHSEGLPEITYAN